MSTLPSLEYTLRGYPYYPSTQRPVWESEVMLMPASSSSIIRDFLLSKENKLHYHENISPISRSISYSTPKAPKMGTAAWTGRVLHPHWPSWHFPRSLPRPQIASQLLCGLFPLSVFTFEGLMVFTTLWASPQLLKDRHLRLPRKLCTGTILPEWGIKCLCFSTFYNYCKEQRTSYPHLRDEKGKDRKPSTTPNTPNLVKAAPWELTVNSVGFVISEEDLTLGPGTRLNHSRAFV